MLGVIIAKMGISLSKLPEINHSFSDPKMKKMPYFLLKTVQPLQGESIA